MSENDALFKKYQYFIYQTFIQSFELTFAILTKWLSISARIFSVWAVKISLTSQKLTCNITTFQTHALTLGINRSKSIDLELLFNKVGYLRETE